MENTKNSTIKHEKLLQEIRQLEIQITAVQEKLRQLENEEKQECYKKNFLEVRKDSLSNIIEFYQSYSKQTNTKLAKGLITYLKFSTANECYDKLLEVYREKYLPLRCPQFVEENIFLEANLNFQQQISNLEKESEQLKLSIEENSIRIRSLLEDVNYVAE